MPPRLIFDGISVEPNTPSELYITDTTFRDGQQAFYAYSPSDVKGLFKLLSELDNGSGRLSRSEFFLYTERDRRIVNAVKGLGLKYPKVIGWGRARVEDVRLVKESGLDEMVMLMSISDIHIKAKFNTTRARVVEKYLEAAEEAMRSGIALRCSLEDVTRADVLGFVVPFVNKLLRLRDKYGASLVIKLPDTTGVGVPYPTASLPYSIPKLIWVMRSLLKIPSNALEFHGHGDYHMAVANAVAAWVYGAGINNGTLLGIGERAGNVPIEALVVWYSRLKGSFDGMEPRVISRIVEYFKGMGYSVPRHQPIVGSNAYATAAGIHIDAQSKDPETYLSMDPSLVGMRETILIGPYTGRSGIAHVLKGIGVNAGKNDETVERVYRAVVRLYDEGRLREPMSEEEFIKSMSGLINGESVKFNET
ncbi:homocitrate synthase/isopropylmalate synthase family protein [Caldivirga maquilingensis]|uniref:Pyruvate carboxyltransferase n=1 Tax=Caldivirga maquilingensis (strain ATCC 700844 / DSM 13496 / JCM 10307 / IC-167) TaxID=397948 RepID=A8MBK1_CALMQ|nr:pyruvate carboxyltransferase [Caldivirga maquilingensis]ABW02734.1 pyruvate carboxyltransferase [Caldivirga maquilingensis IC-167]